MPYFRLMDLELQQDVLHEILLEVKIGFATEEEIVEMLEEMFQDEEGMDWDWVREQVHLQMEVHQKLSKKWDQPTHFQRLASVFDDLISEKFIALHCAEYVTEDSMELVTWTREELEERGDQAVAYCFYNGEDLDAALESENPSLKICFGSLADPAGHAAVGQSVFRQLAQAGFVLEWNGDGETPIKILDLDWKHALDDEDWAEERVLALFPRSDSNGAEKGIAKKPWWRTW